MGSSGSGKSTLLNILGMLDNYDDGSYTLGDVLIKKMDETKAAEYVALSYQAYNLAKFRLDEKLNSVDLEFNLLSQLRSWTTSQ